MSRKIKKSGKVYKIYASRKNSQFEQKRQIMRCCILEAHRDYLLVENLKRYNSKYAGAQKATDGKYKGMPVRRINKDQIGVIFDESTEKWITYQTVRRREGCFKPGRSRGGK